jgi:transitional endoplasmic reticulum ATPase
MRRGTLHVEVVVVTEQERREFFGADPSTPLRAATRGHLLREPLDPELAELSLAEVDAEVVLRADLPAGTPLYTADSAEPAADSGSFSARIPAPPSATPVPAGGTVSEGVSPRSWPETIDDARAVEIAYSAEIDVITSFLRRGISVLVICDKLVVEHLGPLITERSGDLIGVRLVVPDEEQDPKLLTMPRNQRQRQLDRLRDLLKDLKEDQFLMIPHLDLLSGGSESQIHAETGSLVELLYDNSSRLILAFADPSLGVPAVLSERFGGRISISGSPRVVHDPVTKRELALGEALVTRAEAELFRGFKADEFHKHVAGLNPIRLRQALRYAFAEHKLDDDPSDTDLRRTIRGFKAQMSATFEVPDVTFGDIGGYQEVKDEIADALQIMAGLDRIPEADRKLQSELMPRGFIFFGPPGTGKTLFAKAIANRLNATIMVVSGPEVTDKYVGEGERKIRELFASARRNAPSVLVFDEFDAIAGRRTERDDGGGRAGNAMVAQLLTELDGFREDVPYLVIGTTNQLRLIDPAMLRPSRFRPIRIDLPRIEARRAIIRVHAKRFNIELSDELVEMIAEATNFRSGDDIQSIFRDAYVGRHLHDVPAEDPQRLGELVGRLNRAVREQREDTL